ARAIAGNVCRRFNNGHTSVRFVIFPRNKTVRKRALRALYTILSDLVGEYMQHQTSLILTGMAKRRTFHRRCTSKWLARYFPVGGQNNVGRIRAFELIAEYGQCLTDRRDISTVSIQQYNLLKSRL